MTSNYNLGKLHPNLAKEWHPTKNDKLTPFKLTPGSHKKVWWVCTQGHEWKAVVSSRVRGRDCPYCSGRRVGEDNNLAVKFPDLAKEWHPTKNDDLSPLDVTPGSYRKVWWICSQKHKWEARVSDRNRGTGCPTCHYIDLGEKLKKVALKKRGSLADKYPNLIKEWHPTKNEEVTPYNVTPGSSMKVWWRCERGHEWKANVFGRARRGYGCKKCYNEGRRSK